MTQLLALAIIALGIVAVFRKVDVRLALFLAALGLGSLVGQPLAILRKFLTTMADERYVVPICCAMGFAQVLRNTGCDQHLVHLLARPLERVRPLLVPGAVLIGFLVNIPVISQTSTAVTIGTVLIPLLSAARIPHVTIGAAILLGSSVGGELLNPGAPELRTVVKVTADTAAALGRTDIELTGADCVQRILPLVLVQLVIACGCFWFFSRKELPAPETEGSFEPPSTEFRINYVKVCVPLLPLAILLLTGPPFEPISIPRGWLVSRPDNKDELLTFDSRLIGAAMLVGAAAASLVSWRKASESARVFFEGAGYAYTHIISLIVTAACFGEGVRLVGLAQSVGDLIEAQPRLLFPLAGILPCAFAALSGSGMAATQSVYGFFAESALRLEVDPALVGAVVSLAAAAGRTLSPLAAVTLMSATLTNTEAVTLARRVAWPLLIALFFVVVLASL